MSAEFEAGAVDHAGLPPEGPDEVAFVGKSNVGKSSLMNALLGRKNLVRTSSTPGCTRQINLFAVTLKGGRALRLVDLPGYGYARLSKVERASWGERLEGYVQQRTALRCVVLILDIRRELGDDDLAMAEFLRAARPVAPPPTLLAVATKIDKIAKAKRDLALFAFTRDLGGGARVWGVSGRTGDGCPALWTRILHVLHAPSLAGSGAVG